MVNYRWSSLNANVPVTPVRQAPSQIGQTAKAAGEFESILLKQWLQGAESTFGSAPGTDDSEDGCDQQIKEFAVQSMAKALTAAGGIGLAAIVSKALDKQGVKAPDRSDGPTEG